MPYFKCFLSKYLALNFFATFITCKGFYNLLAMLPNFMGPSYTCFSVVLNLHFLSGHTYIPPGGIVFLWAFKFFFLSKFLVGAGPPHYICSPPP